VPYATDIDMTGLQLFPGALDKLLEVRKEDWLEELKGIKVFFEKFKKDLPREMWDEYKALFGRLKE